jgi:hypothetical protein
MTCIGRTGRENDGTKQSGANRMLLSIWDAQADASARMIVRDAAALV